MKQQTTALKRSAQAGLALSIRISDSFKATLILKCFVERKEFEYGGE